LFAVKNTWKLSKNQQKSMIFPVDYQRLTTVPGKRFSENKTVCGAFYLAIHHSIVVVGGGCWPTPDPVF
jgi:hypothetical protein